MLQFAPLQSFVHDSFWHKLAETKLNHDKLSLEPKPIFGYYTNRDGKLCLLEVDYSVFNSESQPPKFCHGAHGTIFNTNTVEEFRGYDKVTLLCSEGRQLIDDFTSGRVLDDPSLLARFFVLSFADLKSHQFFYWFAFPCPLTDALYLMAPSRKLKELEEFDKFKELLKNVPFENQNFFVIYDGKHQSLKTAFKENKLKVENVDKYYFCFADPSQFEYPAWLMRTYAAFIYQQCPNLVGKTVKFMGVRYDQEMRPDNSLIWDVVQKEPLRLNDRENIKFVGWETNNKNKMGPRMVCMRESMDSDRQSENAINLNLKLMKWRLAPDLDLDAIFKTKCLLFGAGTLGCAVARNLLSWGVKHITLIDNGKVSYANPVRQSLYLHADAKAGNKMKAITAAQCLREINPNVEATGHVLQIPMPGHTIGEGLREQTDKDLTLISQLVQEHDVLFLLTDSRESRWLPTVLGAAHQKIVLTSALGFDSYLVLRHGGTRKIKVEDDSKETLPAGLKRVPGQSLGCYFCNDVTAPGNSLQNRPLDQQCTVTRPGVSNLAAAYVVELLVTLLQHPLRELAPAYYSSETKNLHLPEGLLGILPHSIRGMLFNFQNILPATQKFEQCIACSEKVLSKYRELGNEFLFNAFATGRYLEDITGISEYRSLDNEIIEFHEDDVEKVEPKPEE